MTGKINTSIEKLKNKLRRRFSKAEISLDVPERRTGTWFLDVRHLGQVVQIQWRRGDGFGVSSSSGAGYGEGADEVYLDEEAAYGRVVSLLLSKARTSAPESVRLRELRKERGMSQVEMATLLSKQQGAISKLERRHDMLLSTVRDVVRSMGGSLRIVARFPDGVERTLEFEDDRSKRRAGKKANAIEEVA